MTSRDVIVALAIVATLTLALWMNGLMDKRVATLEITVKGHTSELHYITNDVRELLEDIRGTKSQIEMAISRIEARLAEPRIMPITLTQRREEHHEEQQEGNSRSRQSP